MRFCMPYSIPNSGYWGYLGVAQMSSLICIQRNPLKVNTLGPQKVLTLSKFPENKSKNSS